MKEERGYCGIGVVNAKSSINYGTLFRSAYAFGVDLLFLIGRRFQKQSSDTVRAERHIPLFEYPTVEDFLAHRPYDCLLMGVEICKKSKNIRIVSHPERALYILGPEDGSLPEKIVEKCHVVIEIPSRHCFNVAVAGSIVLYDRWLKFSRSL